jgi:hypothetical protein
VAGLRLLPCPASLVPPLLLDPLLRALALELGLPLLRGSPAAGDERDGDGGDARG